MNLDFEKWQNEGKLIEYLREAAESLECCLRDHYLPMKHDNFHNLFENIDERTMDNMAGALKRIIRNVQKNHESLYTYFGAIRSSQNQVHLQSSSIGVSFSPTTIKKENGYEDDRLIRRSCVDDQIWQQKLKTGIFVGGGALIGRMIAHIIANSEDYRYSERRAELIAIGESVGGFLGWLCS